MLKDNDDYSPEDGDLPWEHGYYGTIEGTFKGLPEGPYEVIGDGCYRRLPANPGSEHH
jgi:hypothetical protein